MDERADLMTSIFLDRDELEALEYLSGNDAQTFVDAIDEVSIRFLSLLEMCRPNPTETFYPRD